ncbi:ubiquinone/menaquinone biosynthesis C-methylase UbiE [Saonia flava]|uniref:Ubiquinone/menaquinone biosynthesis C-methylase UbiE n=1 Tax=Saonia flava TaxID=523696 RepID=A0A846R6E7_9FLAO|nr:class I SAM-dependent methyltransferase [Saonia flava]NJB72349.1 ubiquinone/menaquinone biosynthesis C-methylase UbiE [Saonia flava]
MKDALDKFSKQSTTYKKFRPTYPTDLFNFLYSKCPNKNIAWDCGTGNGQVALILSKSFEKVLATDISEKQIQNAEQKENIFYFLERAEKTSILSNSIDLITVAQAIHWFDLAAFNKEAKRVLKPNGVIAIWGYGLLRVNPKINEIIDSFYINEIGKYWNEERKHVDNGYSSILFDFNEIKIPEKFQIQTNWNLEQLEGYFNSWSSVQNYIEQRGINPVDELIKKISFEWKSEIQQVNFPIFIRVGNNKN